MITRIIISIILLLSNFLLPQQNNECGTTIPSGTRPEQVKSIDLNLYKDNTTYNLRLALHIVRFDDGSGGITNERLQRELDTLNFFMEQAGFQFYEYKREYINSNYFANLDTAKLNELFSTYYIDGCINVYFVPSSTFKGWATFSSRFGYNRPQGIVVNNNAYHSTFAHEMGHYFDLLHTHQLWELEEIPGIIDTVFENIDRSGPCKNCYSAGDLLCDTPADPSLRYRGSNLVNDSCVWNTNNNYPPDECNRNDYNPLTDNLMTTELYDHCRTTLTSQQKQRMRETLLNYRDKLLKHLVYLENSDGNSNLGGSLHINDEYYLSGDNAYVETGQYNIGTNEERFFNPVYKHHNWNNNQQDYFLTRIKSIENDEEQVAIFTGLKHTTIRNIIDGMSFNDQLPVWFSDPWYVTDQYGNQLGMGNYITPPPLSPYHPTGAYNQSSGGVFLNQVPDTNNPNKPYYSVKAEAVQDIQLSQTGRTHKFYFQGWSANPQGSAEFQDSSALQTPVVFRQENATVEANPYF